MDADHKESVSSSRDKMPPLEESSGDEKPLLEKCIDVDIEELVHGDLLSITLEECSNVDIEGVQCEHIIHITCHVNNKEFEDSLPEKIPRGLSSLSHNSRTNHFEEEGNNIISHNLRMNHFEEDGNNIIL